MNNSNTGPGGDGGGLVVIDTGGLYGSSQILANGNSGAAVTVTTSKVAPTGGGGGGGGGFIALDTNSGSLTTSSVGSDAGTTASGSLTAFPANGGRPVMPVISTRLNLLMFAQISKLTA